MSTQASASLPPLDVSYEDDPRVVEQAATEDYSLHIVPRTWRMDRGPLTMAWYAVMTAFFYLYFAAFLALAYGTTNALIGIVLSVIVYSLVNQVIVRAASRSGLTVALFSRSMFGFVGASIATLIFAATAIYYTVFEGSVIAVAAQELIGGPIKMWYGIVILLTGPLVWKGVRVWLDRLNAWLLPFYIVGMVSVVVWALADNGYNGFLPDTEAAAGTTLPWLQCFAAYMGVWILMMFTMDFARLSKPSDEKYHVAITFGWLYYTLTFFVNGLLGILLVSTFDISFNELAGAESALPVRIVSLTNVVGLGLIAITQFRINTVNLYLASTNLQGFFSRLHLNLPRTAWVVVACGISFLLMLTNVFSYVLDALTYQGIAIVAWVAVALAHVWYLNRSPSARDVEHAEFRPGRIPAFNPGGILAWGIATATGVILKITDSATSQFFDVWGLLLTFVLGFGIYTVATMAAKPSWFAMDRPGDPALEVDDPREARVRCHACDRSYIAQEMDRDPTAGHQAICAECATSPAFYRASREEAKRSSRPAERELVEV